MESNKVNLKEYYRNKYMNYQITGNFFNDMNPLVKLNIFLAVGIIGILIGSYKVQIAFCAVYYILAAVGKKFKNFAGIYTGLGGMILLFSVIVRQLSVEGNQIIFSVFGWKWTWEALENAFNITFTLLVFSGTVILFFCFTEMRDLMYAFERKGVSHESSYVILSSLQTITDLKKTSQTIMDSQKARGVETEGSIWKRLKALVPVISPLFLSALAATEEKTVAMDARAFSVEREHTFLRVLKPTPAYETVVAVLADLCLAGAVILKVLGYF